MQITGVSSYYKWITFIATLAILFEVLPLVLYPPNPPDGTSTSSGRDNSSMKEKLTNIDWDCSIPSKNDENTMIAQKNISSVGRNHSSSNASSASPPQQEQTDQKEQPPPTQQQTQCRRTRIFPFQVGCPVVCNRTFANHDESNSTTTVDSVPLYRLTAEWYFGVPPKNNDNNKDVPSTSTPPPYDTTIGNKSEIEKYYSKGKTYQSIPESFGNQFSFLSNIIETKANELLLPTTTIPPTNTSNSGSKKAKTKKTIIRGLQYKYQSAIHISLSYLCCLTIDEVYKAKEYINEFVMEQYPYNISIRFQKLECYHERYNSVTIVLILDDDSQLRLMHYNHLLNEYLKERNIPILVTREEQMKFHSTIIGIHYGTVKKTDPPENDISKNLTIIYDIITSINTNSILNSSTNNNCQKDSSTCFDYNETIWIQHAPKVYSHCNADVHANS